MAKYVIEGGREVSGSLRPSGNKNEILPVLAACLLSSQPVTLQRVPRIADVQVMLDLLNDLGVRYQWLGRDSLVLEANTASEGLLSAEKCSKVRAAILLLGPLLARWGKARLPLPGGDVIGARKIDCHFEGLIALGAKVELVRSEIHGSVTPGKLRGAAIFLDEPSVTATENIIMCAVLAEGTTVLEHAASEPHVVGLCELLIKMGAHISGVGSNRLTITGVSGLSGAEHTIGPDFMEMASYLCLGAACGGRVQIDDVMPANYRGILGAWQKLGIQPEITENSIAVDGSHGLQIKADVSGRIPTVYSAPWPGFPTDLMSVAIVTATQATGTMIFFEKMFEGRMFFTDKLLHMGAQIVLCDPHRVVVTGKSQLIGARMSSPDVRAGMALVIAACMARGTSEIYNTHLVERGYDQVIEKLSHLGVAIQLKDS
ncbi:MAG: UDP-N-acetylglucosamine 1-carboxyvinyltransferase [Proteobacteria bacterium]|nr:UDP-N-acetylglucosamine 1-carboxyvinyltransferase [Pseudomonadota bacterium]